jgi:very-short-patch-repair endonuclease
MEEKNNLYYSKSLKQNASALRKTMTKAEACLWKYLLKAKQLDGYSFSRQRPVERYIADFMCKELKLIIEVDGNTHNFENIYIKDQERQRDFEELGFKVIRFNDIEVLKNIEGVRKEIVIVIAELNTVHPLTPASGGQNTV